MKATSIASMSVLVASVALGCDQEAPTSPIERQTAPQAMHSAACTSVQGDFVATISGFDGPAIIFTGPYTGDLIGSATVRLVFTNSTGAVLHFSLEETIEVTGGAFAGHTLATEGKGVNTNLNRITSTETIIDGASGHLTFNGIDTGGGADLSYHGVVCM